MSFSQKCGIDTMRAEMSSHYGSCSGVSSECERLNQQRLAAVTLQQPEDSITLELEQVPNQTWLVPSVCMFMISHRLLPAGEILR